MDFLLYLSTQSLDIYKMISQKVRVVENAPICRQKEIFGWFDSKHQTMTMCTDVIKSYGNPGAYVNETLLHESTHIAQACRMNMREIRAFGLAKSATPLIDRREYDLKVAEKITGRGSYYLEREAFWMEDKPEQVKYVVKKYCF